MSRLEKTKKKNEPSRGDRDDFTSTAFFNNRSSSGIQPGAEAAPAIALVVRAPSEVEPICLTHYPGLEGESASFARRRAESGGGSESGGRAAKSRERGGDGSLLWTARAQPGSQRPREVRRRRRRRGRRWLLRLESPTVLWQRGEGRERRGRRARLEERD